MYFAPTHSEEDDLEMLSLTKSPNLWIDTTSIPKDINKTRWKKANHKRKSLECSASPGIGPSLSILHIVPSLVLFFLPLYCAVSHGVCLCMCLHSTHSCEGSRDDPGQLSSLHSQVCVFVSGGDQLTEVTLLPTQTHTWNHPLRFYSKLVWKAPQASCQLKV